MAPALVFGILLHLGLEAWWRAWQHGEGDRALDAAVAALKHNMPDDIDPVVAVQLIALMVGYDVRWAPAMEHIEVLGVEVQFEGPLEHADDEDITAPDWRIAGKIDALVRIDGRVYVVEHKSTSADLSPGGVYWLSLIHI